MRDQAVEIDRRELFLRGNRLAMTAVIAAEGLGEAVPAGAGGASGHAAGFVGSLCSLAFGCVSTDVAF